MEFISCIQYMPSVDAIKLDILLFQVQRLQSWLVHGTAAWKNLHDLGMNIHSLHSLDAMIHILVKSCLTCRGKVPDAPNYVLTECSPTCRSGSSKESSSSQAHSGSLQGPHCSALSCSAEASTTAETYQPLPKDLHKVKHSHLEFLVQLCSKDYVPELIMREEYPSVLATAFLC